MTAHASPAAFLTHPEPTTEAERLAAAERARIARVLYAMRDDYRRDDVRAREPRRAVQRGRRCPQRIGATIVLELFTLTGLLLVPLIALFLFGP